MNEEHFMLVSIEDSKSKVIADVLGSNTCKKLISYFTQVNEASENDIAQALKMPINTVEYNLKKLIEAGFVQKKQKFFWSKKGKKIPIYELTNKAIVLSPKKSTLDKVKSIIPAFILTGVGTLCVGIYESLVKSSSAMLDNARQVSYDAVENAVMKTSIAAPGLFENPVTEPIVSYASQSIPLWVCFLTGALVATIIITIVNWRKL